MHKKKNTLITILLTGNRQIFKVAESLLNDAGIEYHVKNDGVKDNNSASIGDIIDISDGPIEIQVSNDNLIKARALLADLQELDFDEKTI